MDLEDWLRTSSLARLGIPAESEQQPQPGALKGSFSLPERAVQITLCHQEGVRETGHDSSYLDEEGQAPV